ncbi:zinc metalloprotease HtpX [Acaryochloris sp. IP29b_bin.137]|uniref:zinc metalloprotease HtpX n=1 Tax=Acaryochloris sp. IP29b_bin.137 TaxID=2969217 RepID=UPI00261B1FDF|nr:zinc metalloprotease HtpX [Acaryochloris sp. IP29b_bin.137]
MSSHSESLQTALQALKQERYPEAIRLLEEFCQENSELHSPEYFQAQMALVKAYQNSGCLDKALSLCEQLQESENLQTQMWAQQALPALRRATQSDRSIHNSDHLDTDNQSNETTSKSMPKAGRALAGVVPKLAMKGVASSLSLASGVTLTLLLGMVLALAMSIFLILDSAHPVTGFGISVGVTLLFNTAMFFLSPLIMDMVQRWLYGTHWVSLAEIKRQSPESAHIIERVCSQKGIKQPRLGIIDDQNPTAFTYGSLPNSARLVVSQGLFTYLDDDEIATVYAHELGHIVHWDFAVMTLASTLVQLMYLLYTFARRMGRGKGDSKVKDALETAAISAYIFYTIGTYLLLYLSRTREYYADHFAAEVTGNPNGLSRALVKIAYGIVEEAQHSEEPSRLIEGTRALGIYDTKAATSTGTAYQITSEPHKIGRIFLWDMFNPWAWWMELNSTHPLTGKRVRALSTYAEQLGLPMQFDMGRVMGEGKRLNKRRLYGNFAFDVLLYAAPMVGGGLGLLLGVTISAMGGNGEIWMFSPAFIGFGIGTLIRLTVMFPDILRPPAADVITLMSDPYASPLRGQPVKLTGNLIGRGDAGSKLGSDLKLQDPTGLMYLRYSSRFGSLGNLLFGLSQVKDLIGDSVNVTGWFRRGIVPWIDLTQLKTETGRKVDSYHRFWTLILGAGSIILGVSLPFLFA